MFKNGRKDRSKSGDVDSSATCCQNAYSMCQVRQRETGRGHINQWKREGGREREREEVGRGGGWGGEG